MGKNGRAIALILVFVFLIVSSTSSNDSNPTKPNNSSTSLKQGSPENTTASDSKGSNSSSVIAKAKPKETQGTENNTKVDLNGSKEESNKTGGIPPPNSKSNEDQGKVENAKNAEEGSTESCEGALLKCEIEKTLLACIKGPKDGSEESFIVLHNEGESRLEVKVYTPTSVKIVPATVGKKQTVTVNISSTLSKGPKIIVDAGNGNCSLQLHSFEAVSKGPKIVAVDSLLQQFSLYSKQVTPIYGAYFLFLVALLFGGTWACCKLRKKRQHGGIPYQELEMGLPESSSAVNVDTAEGWDQGWDDDWDEENAVKSPGGHRFGSISANGLTARSAKKDGWENDWDD
nr:SUN domain-containing protein 2 [Ipomoea batatas]GMC85918.1 SUN domain-containing protein 2 [Ipomoea batatas]